jgi:hypothetical protein
MANFPITLAGTYITPLVNPEQKNDYTIRFLIPYSVLVATGSSGSTDTVTVTLGNTPANWYVSGVYAYLNPVFAGTIGGLSIAVGTSGTPGAFLATTSVLSGSLIQPSTGVNTTAVPASSFGATSTVIQALFTVSTSGGISGLTSGSVEILISLNDLNAVY